MCKLSLFYSPYVVYVQISYQVTSQLIHNQITKCYKMYVRFTDRFLSALAHWAASSSEFKYSFSFFMKSPVFFVNTFAAWAMP